MKRPHAIIGSALATALVNVFVASALIFAVTSETPPMPQSLYDPAPLYRLSPIPAGADWGR
jgi:hypothetical protein